MIAAILSVSVEIQIGLFLILSFVCLLAIRPLVGTHIRGHLVRTNADSLIGMTATVTSKINNREGFGKAVIKGQEWSAVSEQDDTIIPEGSLVTIVSISGVKLIVKKEESLC
jgi:membrane protein implicated in regulation of membrane protease activity